MYDRNERRKLLAKSGLSIAKQVLQTTAAVGKTVIDSLEQDAKQGAAQKSKKSDESVVDGSFHVLDPESQQTTARQDGQPEVEVTIITSSGAEKNAGPTGQPHDDTNLNIPPHPGQNRQKQQQTGPQAKAKSGPQPNTQSQAHSDSTPNSGFPFADIPLPLGGITEHLKQWKDKIPHTKSTPPEQSPHQTGQTPTGKDRFLDGSFSIEAGSRAYKLYVPSGYKGQPLPLVVMLHGCTQSPDDFAISTRMNDLAEARSFLALYPAQNFKANFGKCWNWFKESDQQREWGEPAIIAELTQEIVKAYKLDASRVYVAGISAGGAMAMVMAMTYSDVFTAAGIQSGVAYGVANNISSGLAAIKGGQISEERLVNAPKQQPKLRVVPTIVFHGDNDSLVHPDNGEQIINQWLKIRDERATNEPALQRSVHRGQVPNGHSYTQTVYQNGSDLPLMEHWLVNGAGHAWSGGNPDVSWTDAKGPNASAEMLRFFEQHRRTD